MKQAIMAIILVLTILLSGCANDKEETSDISSQPSASSSNIISKDDYKLIRNLFLGQYKSSITNMQKIISKFDASDTWWGNFNSNHQTVQDITNAFMQNESRVLDEYKSDFATIKQVIAQYADALSAVSQAEGKSANEQTLIIAEASKCINQANEAWNSSVSSIQSSQNS